MTVVLSNTICEINLRNLAKPIPVVLSDSLDFSTPIIEQTTVSDFHRKLGRQNFALVMARLVAVINKAIKADCAGDRISIVGLHNQSSPPGYNFTGMNDSSISVIYRTHSTMSTTFGDICLNAEGQVLLNPSGERLSISGLRRKIVPVTQREGPYVIFDANDKNPPRVKVSIAQLQPLTADRFY